jgi:Tfp pilus assembly protein PilF
MAHATQPIISNHADRLTRALVLKNPRALQVDLPVDGGPPMHLLLLMAVLSQQPPTAVLGDNPSFKEGFRLLQTEDNTAANLEGAQNAFDQALTAQLSHRQQATVRAYKALTYLRQGDLEKPGDKRNRFLELGIQETKTATTVDDSCADAWFYRGAVTGRWAQEKGMVKALSYLSDIRGAFQNALKRDPHHTGAALALGLVEKQVPMLMGGSKSSAEKRFRGVLAESPHHTRAMLDLAEFLAEEDRTPEAITWARKARDEEAPAQPGEWRKFDRARALELLKKLKAS